MAFDFKKEYKEFYLPKAVPDIVTVPPAQFAAVRGMGDPNDENGEYKASIGLLYGIAFTIKMSYRGSHKIDGYYEYVVPPLEGFWWQQGRSEIDYAHKEALCFISAIRLPDFVTPEVFDWAATEAGRKKGVDFSKVELLRVDEGVCVQCMHVGPYDDEPVTIAAMRAHAAQQGYAIDHTTGRLHHEIYLSDPRRCDPSRLKTVIRQPVKRMLPHPGRAADAT